MSKKKRTRKTKFSQRVFAALKHVSVKPISYVGLIIALLFFAMSLTPSLLPRTWLFQGVASGLSLISGYAVGVLIMYVWRFLQIRELDGRCLKIAQAIAGVVVIIQVGYVIINTGTWQNHVRELVGLQPAESSHLFRVAVLSILISSLILALARIIRYITGLFIRLINHYVPNRFATVIGVMVAVWFFGSIVSGAFVNSGMRFANNVFAVADRNLKDGSVVPSSTLRSGGPESLVDWESLGRQGKFFVGQGPTADDISRFIPGAIEPIRVFTGLESGESHEQRAELALQELIRTKAFERDKLLIATTTGTGYLDPNAIETFEYIHGGNTAIVGMQYSYLPSWLSLLSDTETAKVASIALFSEVHNYWQELDPDTRPELYLYGLSLGAYGSQASISRVELLNDPVDGALWVGPPFVSEFWNRITDNRDEGSPEWLPVYQDGRVIRFTGPENSLDEPSGQWQDNKIIYIQNATDPVVFFSTDYLWQQPGWLDDDRGPGVTEDMNYYPLVTFWQLALDFFGAGNTPEDFGHLYSKATHIDAWVALTEPEGWVEGSGATLKNLLSE